MRLLCCYVPNLRFSNFSTLWKIDKFINIATAKARIGWQGLRQEEFEDTGEYYLITGTDFYNNKILFDKCKYVSKERFDQDLNIQLKINDILITKDGSIGKVAYIYFLNKPATLNAGVYVVRPKDKSISSKYLFHYLKAPFLLNYSSKASTGGTIKHLNQSVLEKFKIPYSSIEEQRKIVYFLDLIDNRITTQNKIIEDLKTYKKRILREIYYSLETQNRVILNEICTITTGKLDANVMNPNGKYKFFTCAKEDYYIDTFSFVGESLIISGNGEVGLIKYFNGKFDAYQRTYILQNFLVNPLYIKFALEIELPKKIYKEKNIGAMPYIVLSTLSNITIKIPNEDTITKISNLVVSIDKKIAVEEQILNDYKSQKKYLLSNMFI